MPGCSRDPTRQDDGRKRINLAHTHDSAAVGDIDRPWLSDLGHAPSRRAVEHAPVLVQGPHADEPQSSQTTRTSASSRLKWS